MHRLWEVSTEDLRGAGIIGRGYAALFEVRLASQSRSLVSGYSEKERALTSIFAIGILACSYFDIIIYILEGVSVKT